MTAPEITLIITTVATGIVSVIGAIKSNVNSNKLDDNNKKLDEAKQVSLVQSDKIDVIHDATNSSLTIALSKINELMDENKRLKEDIDKFNQRSHVP